MTKRSAKILKDRYWAELVALLIAASAVPLAAGWIPPNAFYGFRTPRSMSTAAEWYRANQLMGVYLLAAMAVALCSKRAVSQAMRSRFGRDRTTWDVIWLCLCALASIGACAVHYYAVG